ncbi:hypothetical protein VPHD69_0107 [Vibrio phage D69]
MTTITIDEKDLREAIQQEARTVIESMIRKGEIVIDAELDTQEERFMCGRRAIRSIRWTHKPSLAMKHSSIYRRR